MVTTALQTPATAPAFPAEEVDACIRTFLADMASAEMALGGGGSARMGFEPSIDSLVIVEALWCSWSPSCRLSCL